MNLSDYSDEQLAIQFRENRDPRLLTELVNRHHPHIIQQCRHRVKDAEAAKDISQEVLIRVMTKIDSYQQEADGQSRCFATWLNTIVCNRCVDHLRQNKRDLHREISQKIEDTLEEELDTDNVEKPTVEILEEMLEKISGEEKLIFLLKYKEKWSLKEIQLVTGLSESAVKMRLSRTKEKIQQLLTRYTVS